MSPSLCSAARAGAFLGFEAALEPKLTERVEVLVEKLLAWVEGLQSRAPGVKVLIVGTHLDQCERLGVKADVVLREAKGALQEWESEQCFRLDGMVRAAEAEEQQQKAVGIRQNKVQGTVGTVGKLIIDNYTSSLRTRASQMQQKNVQLSRKMRFPSHQVADQV